MDFMLMSDDSFWCNDKSKTMTKYMSENSIKSEREINKKNVTSGHYADVFLIYIIKHTRRKWAETLG